MPITEILEENCRKFGNDICLVEINPEIKETKPVSWKEYGLIESNPSNFYRREITWNVFNEKANRFANLLLSRGVKKGDKVGILLMNCLEWLPIYFGVLKTGALAVPLNFRYAADEIEYCVNLAEINVLVFGPEFIGRVPVIATLDELSIEALSMIITQPKNALVKQYKKLLEYDNVGLEVESEAVELIAKKAQAKKTGARGLRAIFEEIMTDVMYDVPSNENVQKVVITASAVENKKPLLVMKDKEKKEA